MPTTERARVAWYEYRMQLLTQTKLHVWEDEHCAYFFYSFDNGLGLLLLHYHDVFVDMLM